MSAPVVLRSHSHRRRLLAASPVTPTWWDPNGEGLDVWAAYQPKGAASFAASKLDLTGNGNHATDGGATPSWDAAIGWIFTGTQWLVTAFVPQTDQSQSALVQFTNGTGANGCLFGINTDGGGYGAFHIRNNWTTPEPDAVEYQNGSYTGTAPALMSGNVGLAGNTGYRNGVPDGTVNPYSGVPRDDGTFIAAFNAGSAQYKHTVNIRALVFYSEALSDAQMAAIYAAMAAL